MVDFILQLDCQMTTVILSTISILLFCTAAALYKRDGEED